MDRRFAQSPTGWTASLALVLLSLGSRAQELGTLHLSLTAVEDIAIGPIDIECERPPQLRSLPALARTADGTWIVVDAVPGETATSDRVRLRWIARMPILAGDHTIEASRVTASRAESPYRLSTDGPHRTPVLEFDGRRVWRRQSRFEPRDFEATYKPFHELYAHDGTTLITKGTGGDFPHHRGLFVGWNQTRAAGKSFDFWHCRDGAHQRRVGGSSRLTPSFAATVDLIEWRDREERAIVLERRELTTWCVSPTLTILDLTVTLESAIAEEVLLDGDPQHAGVQVRLAQEVHDRADQTVYSRDPRAVEQGNDVWSECRFAQITVRVDAQDVSVTHALLEGWPTDSRYSTRAYGRFGACARLRLAPGREAVLRTRLVVARGAMDPRALVAATRRDQGVLSARLTVAR